MLEGQHPLCIDISQIHSPQSPNRHHNLSVTGDLIPYSQLHRLSDTRETRSIEINPFTKQMSSQLHLNQRFEVQFITPPLQRIDSFVQGDKTTFSHRMKLNNKQQLKAKLRVGRVPPINPRDNRNRKHLNIRNKYGNIINKEEEEEEVERTLSPNYSSMISSPHFLERSLIDREGGEYLKELSIFGPATTAHSPQGVIYPAEGGTSRNQGYIYSQRVNLNASKKMTTNANTMNTTNAMNTMNTTNTMNTMNRNTINATNTNTINTNTMNTNTTPQDICRRENEYKHVNDLSEISAWDDMVDDVNSCLLPPIKVNIKKKLRISQPHPQTETGTHSQSTANTTPQRKHIRLLVKNKGPLQLETTSKLLERGSKSVLSNWGRQPQPPETLEESRNPRYSRATRLNRDEQPINVGVKDSPKPLQCGRCSHKQRKYHNEQKLNYYSQFVDNHNCLHLDSSQEEIFPSNQDLPYELTYKEEEALQPNIHVENSLHENRKGVFEVLDSPTRYPQVRHKKKGNKRHVSQLSEYIHKLILKNKLARRRDRKAFSLIHDSSIDLSQFDSKYLLNDNISGGVHPKVLPGMQGASFLNTNTNSNYHKIGSKAHRQAQGHISPKGRTRPKCGVHVAIKKLNS